MRLRLLRDQRVEPQVVTQREPEVHLDLGLQRMRAHVCRGPLSDGEWHLAGQLHASGGAVLRPPPNRLRGCRGARLRDRGLGDPRGRGDAGNGGDREYSGDSPEATQARHAPLPPDLLRALDGRESQWDEYELFGVR